MKLPDSSEEHNEFHAGYEPESGILTRVREWNDLIAWLRLGRVMRMAGSPPLLFLVAITLALWWGGMALLFGSPWVAGSSWEGMVATPESGGLVGDTIAKTPAMLITLLLGMMPSSVLFPTRGQVGVWSGIVTTVWSLFVWMPTMLVLLRQGALLTAGRTMEDLSTTFRMALGRCFRGWVVAVVPIMCAFGFGLMIMLWGAISRLTGGLVWLEYPLAIIVAVFAILCGVLLFGAYFSVPLGWSALVNEKDPDPLDSLSRGYEYLYRRPLSLVLYSIVSLIAIAIISCLSVGISVAAARFAGVMLWLVGSPETMLNAADRMILQFPLIVSTTLFWGLVGGVYLLLRHDACDQEVEDIWQPLPADEPPLPQLPENVMDDES